MTKLLTGAVLALLAGMGTAWAQATQVQLPPPGAEGQPITRDQAIAEAARRFDAMDANKDGTVTPEERRAFMERPRAEAGPGMPPPPPGGPDPLGGPGFGGGRGLRGGGGLGMIERLDANGDGKVTRAEYEAPLDRMDTNKDGFVDQQEAQAAAQAMMAGMGGGQGGGFRGRRFGNGQLLMRLDRDGDGKLTRAEYGALFDRVDTNRDGVVDSAEMAAARERMQARMGAPGPMRRLDPSQAEMAPQ